ncbi:MAG: hypothetical protein V1863_00020 [Candidatus Omnitrophota bacterium]
MNKFLLAPLLIFFEFSAAALFSVPWQVADTLLACVVLFAFFHSFEVRQNILFAFWCGFVRIVFGLQDFAFLMPAYILCGLAVMMLARFLYRFNWFFVFPIVFSASLLIGILLVFLKITIDPSLSLGILVFARAGLLALGTTAAAYLLYLLAKKCVPGLIE